MKRKPFGSFRRSIAIVGGKGGVGKSTIAVNLAVACSAQQARHTLALDGDLGMADLNLLLGLKPERSALDLIRGCPAEEVLVKAHGIHLLPGVNGSYELANLASEGRGGLFTAVDALADRFDTLVVDTAAGISENAMAFAAAVKEVVVVVNPEPLSLADAYACLKVLAVRYGLERAFVLPNSVRSPVEAEETVARLSALVDRFLGIRLVELPAIPYDLAVTIAAKTGKPLVPHSPDAPAARAILRAARRLDTFLRSEESGSEGLRTV